MKDEKEKITIVQEGVNAKESPKDTDSITDFFNNFFVPSSIILFDIIAAYLASKSCIQKGVLAFTVMGVLNFLFYFILNFLGIVIGLLLIYFFLTAIISAVGIPLKWLNLAVYIIIPIYIFWDAVSKL